MKTDLFKLKDGWTKADLKKEYRRLSSKYHPDKGGDVEKMQEVNVAYEYLKENVGISLNKKPQKKKPQKKSQSNRDPRNSRKRPSSKANDRSNFKKAERKKPRKKTRKKKKPTGKHNVKYSEMFNPEDTGMFDIMIQVEFLEEEFGIPFDYDFIGIDKYGDYVYSLYIYDKSIMFIMKFSPYMMYKSATSKKRTPHGYVCEILYSVDRKIQKGVHKVLLDSAEYANIKGMCWEGFDFSLVHKFCQWRRELAKKRH